VSCTKEGDAVTNESILISEVIPATPERIFSAWMDSAEHSAFTGDEAVVVPEVGGEHQSAGGYIKGRTLELNEGSRIVQSWRTTEFPPESPDSRVEITLEPTLGGTLVTLLHTDIPVGQGDRYRQGWNEYYLSRLKTYFADSEPTMETKAPPGEIEVEDGDVESEVVELDVSAETEAPTRIMSQGARSKSPAAKPQARKPAMKAQAPAASAKPAARKPALKAKATAKSTAKATAKAASKKPARLAMKSTKKVAAKASKATGIKASARKAARKPAKAAKVAKKAAAKGAAKSGSKSGRKKGASSARSRRR
jgi:uncharacterized protein YndB with AHSA1/START domain